MVEKGADAETEVAETIAEEAANEAVARLQVECEPHIHARGITKRRQSVSDIAHTPSLLARMGTG